MRTPFVAGNWKMNKSVAEARDLVAAMGPGLKNIQGVEKVICPPFIALVAVANLVSGTVGPFSGINKDGWDYLWFLYDETEDSTAKRVIKRPVAAYVELVYERKSFATLLGY